LNHCVQRGFRFREGAQASWPSADTRRAARAAAVNGAVSAASRPNVANQRLRGGNRFAAGSGDFRDIRETVSSRSAAGTAACTSPIL